MKHRLRNIKNKLIKRAFFYWIEKDFNKYIELLENFKLRRYVKENLTEEFNDNPAVPNAVDYAASFIISMYSEYDDIPEALNTIDEEAEFSTKEFIKSYKKALEEKEYDLIKYFAIPDIQITEEEKELFEDKKQELYSGMKNYSELRDKDFKQAMDKVFQLVSKYYKQNRKKFWAPGPKQYAVAVWYVIYQCVKDLKDFSKQYNINYIDDGEQRCLFNFFNLYIHGILFTGKVLLPVETRRIIFAASALHPAQDDYIDNNEVNEEILEDIYKKLLGHDIQCKVPETKPIFDLIDIIYNKYKPSEHPKLVEIFTKLHEWQCKSMFQKKKKLSEEELLEISFMKGGYAFAFYGYVALGEMDMLQFRHFFGMGAIFQILDDLHDIEVDLNNNVETIWTKRINMKTSMEEAMYGIIGVQRRFESITSVIPSLKKPVFLRRMELFAVRLDLGKFYLANRKYFSDELINNILYRFKFDLRPYMDGYKLKLDQLKTMDDFESMLLDIKNSYTKEFLKRK